MMKACTKCGETKSEEWEFNWKVKYVKRHTWCKCCHNEACRRWRQERCLGGKEVLKQSRRYHKTTASRVSAHRGLASAFKRSPLDHRELIGKRTRVDVVTETTFDYSLRDLLTAKTGIQHHVDHIKPLCEGGVHRMWNLAVVTAKLNLKKGPAWFDEDHITDEDEDRMEAETFQFCSTLPIS